MHLTDGDHLRGLLARYCHLIDAGDFAGVGELMSRATLCTEDGSPLASGADEVAALYAELVKLHDDGTPGTQHVVANTVFERTDEERTARATSTYVVLQATATLPLQPIMTGTYVDSFAQDESGWHFTERRFGVGRAGLLDQHLTVDLTGAGA